MLKAELNQLRQFQTFQAQQFEEMMRHAKEQIVQHITQINNGNHVCLKSPFSSHLFVDFRLLEMFYLHVCNNYIKNIVIFQLN